MPDNYEYDRSMEPQSEKDYSPYTDKQYNSYIRLNTVGASAVARVNDTVTVSQRRSFIDGTCYPQLG